MEELLHFEAFFHLFAAANIAWAGAKRFREALDEQFIKSLHSEADNSINKTIAKIDKAITNILPAHQSAIRDSYLVITANYNMQLQDIEEQATKGYDFVNAYKAMFIFTSFFCLSFLILIGYQNTVSKETLNVILQTLNLCLLFNVYVFVRSFTQYSTKSLPAWQSIVFLITLMLFPVLVKYQFDIRVNVGLALFISCSPFLFHFTKAYIHNNIVQSRILNLREITKANLEQLLRSPSLEENNSRSTSCYFYAPQIIPKPVIIEIVTNVSVSS